MEIEEKMILIVVMALLIGLVAGGVIGSLTGFNDGYDTAKRMNNYEGNKFCKDLGYERVLVSGFMTDDYSAYLISCGKGGYADKPFEGAEFVFPVSDYFKDLEAEYDYLKEHEK